jgi:uncharacterized membrane protein
MDFVRVVILAPSGWLFEAWLLLGAVLAAPVFASSVLTIPLLLDRRLLRVLRNVSSGAPRQSHCRISSARIIGFRK